MGKIVTITYMKEGSPKSWDKKLRTYEITYPEGKKVLWKNITARDCLTKYEGHNSMYNHKCQLRELGGKELQLLKIKDI
tara:strand:- start:1805 stop:2041 length:237 start_codon:yes stop_codon:yes gene_type:complete